MDAFVDAFSFCLNSGTAAFFGLSTGLSPTSPTRTSRLFASNAFLPGRRKTPLVISMSSIELWVASIQDLNKIVQQKIQVFRLLKEKTDWKLAFSFFAPAACYHGSTFFKVIGEDLHTLEKRKEIMNADVLDARFPPSPKIVAALQNNLS